MDYNSKQLDFFNKFSPATTENNSQAYSRSRPLNRDSTVRKITIGIIIFIVANLLSFSFGVERGIRLTKVRKDLKIIPEENSKNLSPIELPSNTLQSEDKLIKDKPEEKGTPVEKSEGKRYAVQVASYRKMVNAEKEADTLRKKGYTSFVLKKGDYVIVCVGEFKDKSDANVYLNKLKKIYSDSILRRL